MVIQKDLCREKIESVKISKTWISPERHHKYNSTVTTPWREKPLKVQCCVRETACSDSLWSSLARDTARQQELLVNRLQWCCLRRQDLLLWLSRVVFSLSVVRHLVPIYVCVCVCFFLCCCGSHWLRKMLPPACSRQALLIIIFRVDQEDDM